jgi:hypothetical protein
MFAGVESPDQDRFALLLCRGERTVIPNQVAYVRFPTNSYDLGQNTRRPEPLPDNASESLQQRHIVVRGERLTIVVEPVETDRKLQLNKRIDNHSSTPTSYDQHSLRWLPTIANLANAQADLSESYFLTPHKARPVLLARVDFDKGRLGTTGAERVQVPFRPKSVSDTGPRSPKSRQRGSRKLPIARELLLEIETDADHFILRSDSFDGVVRDDGSRDESNDMRFELTGDLEIVIGNEAAADIYTAALPTRPLDVSLDRCMAEFNLYYDMCKVKPPDPLMPYLSSRPGSLTCCSGCTFDPDPQVMLNATRFEVPEIEARWSVFAYIAGDNSLSEAVEGDLDELESGDPDLVKVAVQVDRPNRTAERALLGRNGFAPLPGPSLENVNFGTPAALTDFLKAAKRACPTQNTAVFFPTHGTGMLDFATERLIDSQTTDRSTIKRAIHAASAAHFRGSLTKALGGTMTAIGPTRVTIPSHPLGLGPTSNPNPEISPGIAPTATPEDFFLDFLDNEELETGLRGALGDDGPFTILGFDACMMGLVEMAYQLRHCGKYFVASQDDIRADGWPYDEILKVLSAQPTPLVAARAIVQKYADATMNEDLATLSVVDLDEMVPLAESLQKLGEYLVAASTQVMQKVENAVKATSKKPADSHAHGLAVYLPNSPVAEEYHALFLSKAAPAWHDFVVRYAENREKVAQPPHDVDDSHSVIPNLPSDPLSKPAIPTPRSAPPPPR